MSSDDSVLVPVSGRIDAEGRLASAEPRLLELARRAGGDVGAPLALPELAALVRLSTRLGIAIARDLTVADGPDDIDLFVRAEPDADGVSLQLSGWHARPGWRGSSDSAQRAADFARGDADWVWESDAALRVTHLSLDAGARYGFDAATVLGQPLVKLFALAEGEDGGFPILGAVAAQMRFDGQLAELRGTGRKLRLSATPRTDDRGRFAGFVGAAHMLDTVAETAGPAEEATQFPDGFSTQLDKALRQPLERIIANANSMSAQVEGPLAPGYTGYAGDIATAGRHLLGLVDDLVDLEAIERDDFMVDPEPIDLSDVARRAAGLLSVRAAEHNVRIDRPADGELLPATGDFRRSLQVLVNLIGNAVRYSPPGGMVWVRPEREGGAVCVIVADQGKGIAVEDQSRIFDKFERVDPAEAGGSGLGLYISRRLARAMGGDIAVDSAPGQGARFVFTLPAR